MQLFRYASLIAITGAIFMACETAANTPFTKSDASEPKCSVVFQKDLGYTYQNCSSPETKTESVKDYKENLQSAKQEGNLLPPNISARNPPVPSQGIGNLTSSNKNPMKIGRNDCESEGRIWNDLYHKCLSLEETKELKDRNQNGLDEMNCFSQGGRWQHPPNTIIGNKVCLPSEEEVRREMKAEFNSKLASNCGIEGGFWDWFDEKCDFPTPFPFYPLFTTPTPYGILGGFDNNFKERAREEKESEMCRSSGGSYLFGFCMPKSNSFDNEAMEMLKKDCFGGWNSFSNKCGIGD